MSMAACGTTSPHPCGVVADGTREPAPAEIRASPNSCAPFLGLNRAIFLLFAIQTTRRSLELAEFVVNVLEVREGILGSFFSLAILQ